MLFRQMETVAMMPQPIMIQEDTFVCFLMLGFGLATMCDIISPQDTCHLPISSQYLIRCQPQVSAFEENVQKCGSQVGN